MKAATVREDFERGLTSSWVVVSGSPQVVSGRLAMAAEPGETVGIRWAQPVDLTGSAVFIHAVPDVTAITRFGMALTADSGDEISVRVISTNPGALRLRMRQSGVTTDAGLDFDPVAHAWWRVRESGGSIYFDTSANGRSWSNRRVATHTIPTGALSLAFTADAVELEAGFGGGMFGVNPGFGD